MNSSIKSMLKSMSASMQRYGKLDNWKSQQNISLLGRYIKSNEDEKSTRRRVRNIRDMLVMGTYNIEEIVSCINRLLEEEDKELHKLVRRQTKRKGHRVMLDGQECRFKAETGKIFGERLKFRNGMLLRNFDIETEAAADSRKVRRIVEKRMCQAYHRMHRRESEYRETNNERYWMDRATSFQLYNIGQLEPRKKFSRGMSTHWKRQYDMVTGCMVYKKKTPYGSYEEAWAAIDRWYTYRPMDMRSMAAYRCTECGKWHIGHQTDWGVEQGQTELSLMRCV